MMKRKIELLGLILALSLVTISVQAQEVSDEDLVNYAVVMFKIDSLRENLKVISNDFIKSNPLMDRGRKFNEIKSANGDSMKLSALKVTPEELATYDSILMTIDETKLKFKQDYTTVIKANISVNLFNQINKLLKTNDAIRQRYQAIVEELPVEEV